MTHYYIELATFAAQWYIVLCAIGTAMREFVVAQRRDTVIVLNLDSRA